MGQDIRMKKATIMMVKIKTTKINKNICQRRLIKIKSRKINLNNLAMLQIKKEIKKIKKIKISQNKKGKSKKSFKLKMKRWEIYYKRISIIMSLS